MSPMADHVTEEIKKKTCKSGKHGQFAHLLFLFLFLLLKHTVVQTQCECQCCRTTKKKSYKSGKHGVCASVFLVLVSLTQADSRANTM